MSNDDRPAGNRQDAGITQAEHEAAVSAAQAAGERAALERISTIAGAEGIRGDAGRITAALDLAVKSPSMSGDDIVAYVVANVPASSAAADSAADYEQERIAAAAAAQPRTSPAASAQTGWGKAVEQANARFGTDAH